MPDKKNERSDTKTKLHPRNKHRARYDFALLIDCLPELGKFVFENKYGDQSIDFFNAEAVLALNKSLLMKYYGVENWDIPKAHLCPPIPGRADYIHHIADYLASRNFDKIPKGNKIKCLDIGVGTNCIYPIIGHSEYGWSFIASDIDPVAIASSNTIIDSNPKLGKNIECRLQRRSSDIFKGIIQKEEKIDLSICNPPFHASRAESQAGSLRKLSHLKNKKINEVKLNFGGKSGELWTEGGEKRFILTMIEQSAQFAKSCFCFSTLVSKRSNLKFIYRALKNAKVGEFKTIEIGQGNKISRIVVWSFLTKEEEKNWIRQRW